MTDTVERYRNPRTFKVRAHRCDPKTCVNVGLHFDWRVPEVWLFLGLWVVEIGWLEFEEVSRREAIEDMEALQ